jgi:para-nitrobenzyl esterase
MKSVLVLAALALFSLGAAPPAAQAAMPTHPNLLKQLPAKGHLTVTTPAWKDGGDIPFENTQYRGNVFPGLAWSAGPAGTKSYAIIMQDTDASRDGKDPILHWTMYNLPVSVTSLPAGMTPDAKPAGASYGPNVRGMSQPYMGPHPPPGPKHHYHLQVFALDTELKADPDMSFDQLLDGMKGHVLAAGEVGQFDPQSKK